MNRTVKDHASQNLTCIHWVESLDQAYRLMNEKKIRHLPVVDDRGAIVGLISDRDFQRAMFIDQPDFVSGKTPQPEFDPRAKVRDFMSWPVETIGESETIAHAARTMIDKKISSLLVIKGADVTGIVTTNDMLRALLERPENLLEDLKSRARSAIYDSPIGTIAQTLSNIGI